MKTSHCTKASPHRSERGMAVIIVMVIIAILLIYVGGNLRTLHLLQRDLRQVEQRQLVRLKALTGSTNSVPSTNTVDRPRT